MALSAARIEPAHRRSPRRQLGVAPGFQKRAQFGDIRAGVLVLQAAAGERAGGAEFARFVDERASRVSIDRPSATASRSSRARVIEPRVTVQFRLTASSLSAKGLDLEVVRGDLFQCRARHRILAAPGRCAGPRRIQSRDSSYSSRSSIVRSTDERARRSL